MNALHEVKFKAQKEVNLGEASGSTQAEPSTSPDGAPTGTAPAVAGAEATTTQSQSIAVTKGKDSPSSTPAKLANKCSPVSKQTIVPQIQKIEQYKFDAPDWKDVAELKSEWDINQRDLAKAATAAMDNQADIYICLAKARAILSQRGDKYAKMRDEAGILNPKTGKRLTWIEYYAWFQSQYNFDKCLRTVQFKLAEMSGKKRVPNPYPPLQLTAADKHKLVDSALESHHLVEAIRNGGDVNTAVKELQKNLPPKDKLQDIADNAARVLNSDDGVKTPKSVALCKTVNIPSEIDPNLASETLSVLTDVAKQLQQGELAIRVRHLLNKLSGRMDGSGVTPKAVKQEVIPPAKKNVAQLNVPAQLEGVGQITEASSQPGEFVQKGSA